MLAIDSIVTVEPGTRLSIPDQPDQLGLSPAQARVYSRLYGFDQVPVAGVGEEFALLDQAVGALLDQAGTDPTQVGVVVHAHTGPYVGPVGAALPTRLARRFGDDVLAIGTQSHKCVASITALGVVDRLLATRPVGTAAVLLIGESANSRDLRILDTGIAGDLACAVLLRRDGPRNRVRSHTVAVHGQYAGGIYADPKAPTRQEYERRFQEHLGGVITAALDRAGITVDDLSHLLPHNVNVNVWTKAAARLGIPSELIHLDNVPRLGHCFGADVFVNLAAVQDRMGPGDYALMASVGVGGTFGAAVIQR